MTNNNIETLEGWDCFTYALEVAVRAHRQQERWDGTPYILHPLRITYKCSRNNDPLLMSVAILHDTIEDTPVKLEDLEKHGLPSIVLKALDCITKRKDENYADYITRVQTSELATQVKLYDLEDNMNILTNPTFSHPDRFEKNTQRLRKYWKAYHTLTSCK